MGKFHELLAVEGDLQRTAEHVCAEAETTFGNRQAHFWGQTKTVRFFDEARSGENTEETKAMESTVDDKLGYVAQMTSRYYDAVLQKDMTNQKAKADLIVEGKTIAANLPSSFLLGLEQKLARLRAVYNVMPTLNPGTVWIPDPDQGEGVFVSEVVKQMKTEKVIKPIVLYEATKEHPAQVKETSTDVPVAAIETTAFSGMLTVARKSEILDRLDKLIRAVKKARQRANNIDAEKAKVGMKLFDYINEGELPSE